MPRHYQPSVLRTACLAALLLLSQRSPAQPGLLVVGGTSFDLATVYRGSVVEHTLTLKNSGTDTLLIGRVDVSCGCTGSVVSNDRIPPGGTGTLLITFNSRNFTGPVHKTVTVHSNAHNAGETLIQFTATVVNEIALNPQHLLFQDAEVKQTRVVTITVTNNGASPLSLKGFKTQMKGLVLKLPADPIAPGATASITGEFTPDAPSPLINEGVFLMTDNPHQPEVYIQVFGSAREFKFE